MSLSPRQRPGQNEDASGWFDDATADIVRTRAALAANLVAIDGQNVMRLLKLARRTKPATSAVPVPNQMSAMDREKILREMRRLGVGAAKKVSSDQIGSPGANATAVATPKKT